MHKLKLKFAHKIPKCQWAVDSYQLGVTKGSSKEVKGNASEGEVSFEKLRDCAQRARRSLFKCVFGCCLCHVDVALSHTFDSQYYFQHNIAQTLICHGVCWSFVWHNNN